MTTPPGPTKITIDPTPITSPLGTSLITSLDTEVEALYPDWRSFPFSCTDDGTWLNEDPSIMDTAQREGHLGFFVAFVSAEAEGGAEEGKKGAEQAVGCVCVRVLPWFPYHARPTGHEDDGEGGSENGGREKERVAEVKRMYVVPALRRRKVVVVGNQDQKQSEKGLSTAATAVPTSVAVCLLKHAERYARDVFKAQRLVLETGMRQYAAMALYASAGYTRRAEYGEYIGAGEDVGGLSRCWEKML